MDEIVGLVRPEIYAMKPYSSARTEATADARIYLDANENPYPPYPGTDEVVGYNRYPQPQPRVLLDRFAEVYGVERERLFLSRGADEAIDLLVRAFCRAREDAILITPPTFVMYETAAAIQDVAVHRVPLIRPSDAFVRPDDGYQLDVDAILATQAAHPGTKLVFVCSPNNPTGNLLRRADVLRLAATLFGRALVVVDELYLEYSGQPSLAGHLDAYPNLVVVRSVSKEFSLAGERVGVTVADPEVIGVLGRIMAPYSLPVSAVRTVAAAMTADGVRHGREIITRIVAERDRVSRALAASPGVSRVFASDANFLLVRVDDAAGLTAAMAAHGIRIRDRSGAVANTVRISIGTPAENDEMLKVLADQVVSAAQAADA